MEEEPCALGEIVVDAGVSRRPAVLERLTSRAQQQGRQDEGRDVDVDPNVRCCREQGACGHPDHVVKEDLGGRDARVHCLELGIGDQSRDRRPAGGVDEGLSCWFDAYLAKYGPGLIDAAEAPEQARASLAELSAGGTANLVTPRVVSAMIERPEDFDRCGTRWRWL